MFIQYHILYKISLSFPKLCYMVFLHGLTVMKLRNKRKKERERIIVLLEKTKAQKVIIDLTLGTVHLVLML